MCPGSEGQKACDILAAFRRLVKVEQRTGGNDAGGIDAPVALVIVPFDMVKFTVARDARDLVDVARVGPEIAVVDQVGGCCT